MRARAAVAAPPPARPSLGPRSGPSVDRPDRASRGAHTAPLQLRAAPATAIWERLLVAAIVLVWSTTLVVDFRVALTLVLVLAFGAATLGLGYPRLGLLGIGMICTLNEIAAPFLMHGGLLRWNTVNYWCLLVTVLFLPSVLGVGPLQTRVLVAFILLLGAELLLSPDLADGIPHVLAVVAVFGLILYFRRAALDRDAWYWLGVVTGVLAAGGCAAFLLQQGRLPYLDPNAWSYAPLTALFAISLAFVVTEGAPGRRLVLTLLAAVNGVWAFLSGSRGSILLAAVCLGFVLTMLPLRRAAMFGIVAVLASVVVLSQFTALEERALSRVRLFTDPNRSLSTRTSGRFDVARGGWYIFADHPFGVGTGGFRSNWRELTLPEGFSRWKLRHPESAAHSAWIKVLAENGVPGILLLGAYVLSFGVSGWRAQDRNLRRLGMMVTTTLAFGWCTTEFQWNKGLWLLAAGATVLLDPSAPRSLSRHAPAPARR